MLVASSILISLTSACCLYSQDYHQPSVRVPPTRGWTNATGLTGFRTTDGDGEAAATPEGLGDSAAVLTVSPGGKGGVAAGAIVEVPPPGAIVPVADEKPKEEGEQKEGGGMEANFAQARRCDRPVALLVLIVEDDAGRPACMWQLRRRSG